MPKPTPRAVSPVNDHFLEMSRFVERLRRSTEETQLHCRRQREMLDEQRSFLRELDERLDARRRACAEPRATTSRGDSGGGTCDGE